MRLSVICSQRGMAVADFVVVFDSVVWLERLLDVLADELVTLELA
ncbi:hypothetical protein [Lapidilactobacillus concavus]|nr:hypothetical protein [Lapidilactobacillus concavus]